MKEISSQEQEQEKKQVAEGKDQMTYAQSFWEGEMAAVEKLNLPTYASFNANYPQVAGGGAMDGPDVFELIGGEVHQLAQQHGYNNACAARVSRALVKSGVNIPKLNDQTFLGEDGKYHFLGARNLYEWMLKAFGEPDLSLTQEQARTDGTGFFQASGNKPGIYIMIPKYPKLFGASGHADKFDGYKMNKSGYFGAEGGVFRVCLWKLK